jgi:hypothetical protein
MVLSGRLPNNFFVYEIPQPPYAMQMETGYTLMRRKLTYLQTISLILFNLTIPFSFRKKLI